jgi:dTDP-glucose 4,6-dehydratase
MRYKNLLITGGAGFIGSNFIKYYLNNHEKVNIINLDLLTYAGNLNNLKEVSDNDRYKFVHGNICDPKLVYDVFKNFKIDGVINFAAETHVDNSIINPDVFIETNINGVLNLLNISYKFWMKSPFKKNNNYKYSRFHQISTDEVYGSIINGSFTENSKYAPNSPYSASKASADLLVRSFNKTYGLDTSISICSNNFGTNQHVEKLIPKIITKLLADDFIPVYGDGKNIRDWIFVEDHCRAVDLIFNKSQSGMSYNVSSGNELSNLKLIKIISKLLNIDNPKLKFIQDRFGHDRRYSLSSFNLKYDLNWNIKTDFKINLVNLIKVYSNCNVL